MRPPRATSTTAPGITFRSTSCRNVAETRARRFADSPTSFGRSAFGNPSPVICCLRLPRAPSHSRPRVRGRVRGRNGRGEVPSVREGWLGDLGLLKLGQDLLPEPLELFETFRFGHAYRQAHRHPI